MSHNPWPHGPPHPPPPYHPGYSYPPPPGGYAYVPTPVMMPVPAMPVYPVVQPQPTPHPAPPSYVPPPHPQPYADPIDWVPATGFSAPGLVERAFVAGKEAWDGSPLCVIRAHHSGELVPGKLAIKHRSAYIPHGGKEVPVHNFEVLCVPEHMVHWVTASHGSVPPDAIIAGNTHNAEPLYICRVKHMRSVTPGKVHPSHGCAYISFGGSEHSYKHYEVLCKVNTSTWR
ncbi:uncharacterized protein LOC125242230 [Leguminivora glycinivorella]|uniref:uncharacterized protein LOC125242230 n=1 Tax=Leguminivora glycinivorella TaxID=1035111 RepID=UPI00200BD3B2|nr:uncharacterized protein LOC125242230 [Leguminivora glycinivorella]